MKRTYKFFLLFQIMIALLRVSVVNGQEFEIPFNSSCHIVDIGRGNFGAYDVGSYQGSFKFFRYSNANLPVQIPKFRDLHYRYESGSSSRAYWDVNQYYDKTGNHNSFTVDPTILADGTSESITIIVINHVKHANDHSVEQTTSCSNFTYTIFQPEWLTSVSEIRRVCQDHSPIVLQDYFKEGISPVFTINGSPVTTLDPAALSVGIYNINASATFDNGTYSESITVEILPKPVVIVTPEGSTDICEGTTLTLDAPVAPAGQAYTYLWNTGQTSPQITVSDPADYSVTVSNGGCETTSPTVTVTTKPVPDPDIAISGNTNMCDGESTVLTAANAAGYAWYKNGILMQGEAGQSLIVISAGTYNAVLTNANGCTTTTEQTVITVKPNPRPTVTVTGATAFCDGGSVTLTAQSSGIPLDYTWSNGVSGQTLIVKTSGIYTVTVRNPGECQAVSLPVIVTVNPVPEKVLVTGSTAGCIGDKVRLTATSTIPDNTTISYNWYKSGNAVPFYTGGILDYEITGGESIFVSASAGSAMSCSSALTEVRLTALNPTGDFSANAVKIPLGGLVKFTSATTGSVSYLWDFGDGTKSTNPDPVHYYYKAGSYSVTLNAYSATGCILSVTHENYILVDPDPVTIVPPGNDTSPVIQDKGFTNTVIYPNPVRNGQAKLRIFNKEGQTEVTVEIYTISGRLLNRSSYSAAAGQNDIELQKLSMLSATTYYLVRVQMNNQSLTFKILIL